MVQFIPNNLNIVKFVEQHKPINIQSFKIDKLIHILNLIYYIPANNKSLVIIIIYFPINIILIKKKIKIFKNYLNN